MGHACRAGPTHEVRKYEAREVWWAAALHVQSKVPALPVLLDSPKGRACPPDFESIHAAGFLNFPREMQKSGSPFLWLTYERSSCVSPDIPPAGLTRRPGHGMMATFRKMAYWISQRRIFHQ